MKLTATVTLMLALSTSGLALAQSGDMKGMDMKGKDMKGMDMQQCHEMMKGKKGGDQKEMDMKGMDMKGMDMKGMDMKDMDMQKCHEMMGGTEKNAGQNAKVTKHQATAVVKSVDASNGKVTLAHEPVKSLKWPAMTMGFAVKDKNLFDKLTVGKKVDVAFTKQGSEYVVTSVK